MNYDLLSQGASTWVNNAGMWEQQQSPEMGIAAITGISAGAGAAVPALLFHTNWGNPLPNTRRSVSVDQETLGGRPVYRLTSAIGSRLSSTVWIDQKTLFLVKSQQVSETPKNGTYTFTVTYSAPIVNETIPANAFTR